MNVCVLGLGQVGLPSALYIAHRGTDTWGYDVNEEAVIRARSENIRASTKWSEIPPADVYVVCVGTTVVDDRPNLTNLFDACQLIASSAKNNSLVSIESTILPGTCRKIHEKIFNGKLFLIHVPHRYWPGGRLEHGVNQIRPIGALNEKDLALGLKFYQEKLGINLHITPSIEVAEMSKITENAYRFVQIAFAEELKLKCEKLGLRFEDVRASCNTKWNIDILEARNGINGHCLPKDIRYLASLSNDSPLLSGAMSADAAYKQWLVEKSKLFTQSEECLVDV
ncbi:MAG: NAD(P)-binding domain-containing protein [Promethearchaeota archaeon]